MVQHCAGCTGRSARWIKRTATQLGGGHRRICKKGLLEVTAHAEGMGSRVDLQGVAETCGGHMKICVWDCQSLACRVCTFHSGAGVHSQAATRQHAEVEERKMRMKLMHTRAAPP
eukprot:94956-Pelagomonas_calceolata.AAC.3